MYKVKVEALTWIEPIVYLIRDMLGC